MNPFQMACTYTILVRRICSFWGCVPAAERQTLPEFGREDLPNAFAFAEEDFLFFSASFRLLTATLPAGPSNNISIHRPFAILPSCVFAFRRYSRPSCIHTIRYLTELTESTRLSNLPHKYSTAPWHLVSPHPLVSSCRRVTVCFVLPRHPCRYLLHRLSMEVTVVRSVLYSLAPTAARA
jgi:hypothetical protein